MRRCPRTTGGIFMGYIVGEGRSQGSLFPIALDDLVPADHVCRVIDAFVGSLDVTAPGFGRAEAADTGRPGYDPRDLLKLYLYGYLQQIRSSRRLEAECRRNVELMWLLGRISGSQIDFRVSPAAPGSGHGGWGTADPVCPVGRADPRRMDRHRRL